MFEKIKFWKKQDEDFDILHRVPEGFEQNPMPAYQDAFSQNQAFNQQIQDMQDNTNNPFGQQQFPTPQGFIQNQNPLEQHLRNDHSEALAKKDIELILAKLETIKVSLDNLSHRVEKLEQSQRPQQARW